MNRRRLCTGRWSNHDGKAKGTPQYTPSSYHTTLDLRASTLLLHDCSPSMQELQWRGIRERLGSEERRESGQVAGIRLLGEVADLRQLFLRERDLERTQVGLQVLSSSRSACMAARRH